MVIFSRTYDLLDWLLRVQNASPGAAVCGDTKRLQDAALDFQEALFLANSQEGRTRETQLRMADAHLNKLRLYLRLVTKWNWLSGGQYEHASKMVAEIGRLLGGWLKQTRGK